METKTDRAERNNGAQVRSESGLDLLRTRHPTQAKLIKSLPLPDCPQCKGAGEYVSKAGPTRGCMCVCLSGEADLRLRVVTSFRKTIKEMAAELRASRSNGRISDGAN